MEKTSFKNNREQKNENLFLLTIQAIGTFIVIFIIAFLIVIAFMPGKFTTKISEVAKYIEASVGLSKEPEVEENSILETASDIAKNIDTNNIQDIESLSEAESQRYNNQIDKNIYVPQVYEVANNTPAEMNSSTIENTNIESEPIKIASSLYYSQLNDNAKKIYQKLSNESGYFLKGTHVFDFGTTFNELLNQPNGQEELNMAFQAGVNALVLDYPQLYFIDITKMMLRIQESRYIGFNPVYRVSVSNVDGTTFYADGLNNEQEVLEAIRRVEEIRNNVIQNASRTSKNTYEFIRYVHDYIVDTVTYDDSGLDGKKFNLCFAALEGRAVCEGYAKLFKYIMDGAGIPTVTVTGEGINSNGRENHAWNQVYFEGQWYGVDTTWDDPIIIGGNPNTVNNVFRYRYFLVGQREFEGNHIPLGNVTPGIFFGSLPLPASRYIPNN